MEGYNSKLLNLLNMYAFVKTENDRNNPDYVKQRLWEVNLMKKQRMAVKFCKDQCGIKTTELPKITDENKVDIEKCLTENFLKDNPDFFGQRDTIFLDLHEYNTNI